MDGWVYIHDLDPEIIRLGPLRIGWYGMMYFLAFMIGYWGAVRLGRRPDSPLPPQEVSNLLTYLILGVFLGARMGWILFYGGWEYWLEPYRMLEVWKGGMSFHGGLIGVTLALYLYARRHRIPPLVLGEHVLIFIPMGLFLGRIGNFINGELYGAPTYSSWGVIFPRDPQQVPRHPSQLYEAFGEGVLIFLILLLIRGRFNRPGLQPAVFLLLYGSVRIAVEFVRLPDKYPGYLWEFATMGVTMGQVLSLPMLAIGLGWTGYLIVKGPNTGKAAA